MTTPTFSVEVIPLPVGAASSTMGLLRLLARRARLSVRSLGAVTKAGVYFREVCWGANRGDR